MNRSFWLFLSLALNPYVATFAGGDFELSSYSDREQARKESEARREAYEVAQRAHADHMVAARTELDKTSIPLSRDALDIASSHIGQTNWENLLINFKHYRDGFKSGVDGLTTGLATSQERLAAEDWTKYQTANEVAESLITGMSEIQNLKSGADFCTRTKEELPQQKFIVGFQFKEDAEKYFSKVAPTQAVDSKYDFGELATGKFYPKSYDTYDGYTSEIANASVPSSASLDAPFEKNWARQSRVLLASDKDLPTLHFSDPRYGRIKNQFENLLGPALAGPAAFLMAGSGITSASILSSAEDYLESLLKENTSADILRAKIYERWWRGLSAQPQSYRLAVLEDLVKSHGRTKFAEFAMPLVQADVANLAWSELASRARIAIKNQSADRAALFIQELMKRREAVHGTESEKAFDDQASEVFRGARDFYEERIGRGASERDLFLALTSLAHTSVERAMILSALKEAPSDVQKDAGKNLILNLQSDLRAENSLRRKIFQESVLPPKEGSGIHALDSFEGNAADKEIFSIAKTIQSEWVKNTEGDVIELTPRGVEQIQILDRELKMRNDALIHSLSDFKNQASSLKTNWVDQAVFFAGLSKLRMQIDGNWDEALKILENIQWGTLSEQQAGELAAALSNTFTFILDDLNEKRAAAFLLERRFNAFQEKVYSPALLDPGILTKYSKGQLKVAVIIDRSIKSTILTGVQGQSIEGASIRNRIQKIADALGISMQRRPQEIYESLHVDDLINILENPTRVNP